MVNGMNIAAVIILVVIFASGVLLCLTEYKIERWWKRNRSDIALWIGKHIYHEDWRRKND